MQNLARSFRVLRRGGACGAAPSQRAGYSSTTEAPPESSNGEAVSSDTRIATGLSLVKGDNDPPIGPPEAYPLWLQDLAEALPSLGQLTRADEDALSVLEKQRLLKLSNREAIRDRNYVHSKKK